MEEFIPIHYSLLITLSLFWFLAPPTELTVVGAAQVCCHYVVQQPREGVLWCLSVHSLQSFFSGKTKQKANLTLFFLFTFSYILFGCSDTLDAAADMTREGGQKKLLSTY